MCAAHVCQAAAAQEEKEREAKEASGAQDEFLEIVSPLSNFTVSDVRVPQVVDPIPGQYTPLMMASNFQTSVNFIFIGLQAPSDNMLAIHSAHRALKTVMKKT